jgi:hypothetical protein
MKLVAKSAASKFLTEYFRGDVPVGRAVYSEESKEFVFLPFPRVLFSKDELEEISAMLSAINLHAPYQTPFDIPSRIVSDSACAKRASIAHANGALCIPLF